MFKLFYLFVFRYALSHNVSMLLFTMFPYPLTNLTLYLLHRNPLLNLTNPDNMRFHIAADHMRYERQGEFIQKGAGDRAREGEIKWVGRVSTVISREDKWQSVLKPLDFHQMHFYNRNNHVHVNI